MMHISFIHNGGPSMASYRYRAEIPARMLGASINDYTADIFILAKPSKEDLLHTHGKRIVADFCDDHFDTVVYQTLLQNADAVSCPTYAMWERIRDFDRDATVIPDPYEFPKLAPHCRGDKVLWFGHSSNLPSLERVWNDISRLTIVSNAEWAIPWSMEAMLTAFLSHDIVILPATASYKSPNRAIEAIRQGCFVVAEPHPSINDFPGIWIGNIKEGIEWATQNPNLANLKTAIAQDYIQKKFSPQTQADAWRNLLNTVRSRSTWDAGVSAGRDGSTLIQSLGIMHAT